MTVFGAIAAVGALLCAALAWRVPWRMGRRVAVFRDELAVVVGEARDDGARVAAVNEALGALDHDLRPDTATLGKLGWIAFGGGAVLMMAGWLIGGSWSAPAAGIVAAAAAGCFGARTAARRAAERARARADRLVREMVGELYDAEIVLPRRRAPRFRR